MVERITLFKLVDGAARAGVAAEARAALAKLEGVRELSVGLPSDAASEKSWDVSVIMRFDEQTALERALESRVFTDFIAAMAGRYAVIKAWSFARLA